MLETGVGASSSYLEREREGGNRDNCFIKSIVPVRSATGVGPNCLRPPFFPLPLEPSKRWTPINCVPPDRGHDRCRIRSTTVFSHPADKIRAHYPRNSIFALLENASETVPIRVQSHSLASPPKALQIWGSKQGCPARGAVAADVALSAKALVFTCTIITQPSN